MKKKIIISSVLVLVLILLVMSGLYIQERNQQSEIKNDEKGTTVQSGELAGKSIKRKCRDSSCSQLDFVTPIVQKGQSQIKKYVPYEKDNYLLISLSYIDDTKEIASISIDIYSYDEQREYMISQSNNTEKEELEFIASELYNSGKLPKEEDYNFTVDYQKIEELYKEIKSEVDGELVAFEKKLKEE